MNAQKVLERYTVLLYNDAKGMCIYAHVPTSAKKNCCRELNPTFRQQLVYDGVFDQSPYHRHNIALMSRHSDHSHPYLSILAVFAERCATCSPRQAPMQAGPNGCTGVDGANLTRAFSSSGSSWLMYLPPLVSVVWNSPR